MRRVVVESPLKGDYESNRRFACACVSDCLKRGEAPYASHLFFDQPGILDDTVEAERELGIAAGFAWGEVADATVVYTDRGISDGMKRGIDAAHSAGRPVEYRELCRCKGTGYVPRVIDSSGPSDFVPCGGCYMSGGAS